MRLNFFSKKNLLDEMQEQTLLKLESRCFWLLWWGLLISMMVQELLGATVKDLAGEWIIFMIACVYMLEECLRNGIWDRHIRANTTANVVGSLLAGIVVFLFTFAQRSYWPGSLLAGMCTAVLCFAVLQGTTFLYKKRHNQLEDMEEDEDEHTA